MPKPYSYDLRQKVIQAIELNGLKKRRKSSLSFTKERKFNNVQFLFNLEWCVTLR